jgi:acetyl esterase/lipase
VKKILTFSAFLFLLANSLSAQALLTSVQIGAKSKAQLQGEYPFVTFTSGAVMYKVTYESKNIDGSTAIVSGLISVPDNLDKRYPLLCYQHGTSSTDDDVPSNLNTESTIPVSFSGLGYVVFAPDYLGLGDSPGPHPYVHAASEAWVAIDMLKATKEFAAQNNIAINEQLFITGYSQGGHAAMAMHEVLEDTDEFEVTAAAPMSGPYSIGEVMRELIFSGEEYSKPGYLINTIASYQFVYQDIFTEFSEAFRAPYEPLIVQFLNEEISLDELDLELVSLLNANEGAVIPVKLLQDDFVASIQNNPDHPANLHLKENNTYDGWVPSAPTRLYYCQADDQVPYENSILAANTMQAAGAADVQVVDVNSALNHVTCAFFAPANVVSFFKNYQMVEDLTAAKTAPGASPFRISPNPTGGELLVKNLPADSHLRLSDLGGKVLFTQTGPQGDAEMDLGHLPAGVYLLQIVANGQAWTEKLVKN